MSTLTNYENPGLIKQTNSEYYAGKVTVVGSGITPQNINWPTNLTPLIWTDLPTAATQKSVNNYDVYIDNVLQTPGVANYISDQVTTTLTNANDPATSAQTVTIAFTGGVPNTSLISIQLRQESIWDNYKNYQYSTLSDIVANFMMSYVGTDRIIKRARRSEIIFHAKRGLQEFSYDTLRSVNTQELTIPANLSLPLPQDYVNYVQLSYVDGLGVKHIIYPTTLTSNPMHPNFLYAPIRPIHCNLRK